MFEGRYQREDVTLNSKVHTTKTLRLWNYYYLFFVNDLKRYDVKWPTQNSITRWSCSQALIWWNVFLNSSKLQNVTWTQNQYYKICAWYFVKQNTLGLMFTAAQSIPELLFRIVMWGAVPPDFRRGRARKC